MEGQSQKGFKGCWTAVCQQKWTTKAREKSAERGEWKNSLSTMFQFHAQKLQSEGGRVWFEATRQLGCLRKKS